MSVLRARQACTAWLAAEGHGQRCAMNATLTQSVVQEDGHLQRVLVPEGQRVAVGTPVVRAPESLRAVAFQ